MDMIKMVLVLTILSVVSGGALAKVKVTTDPLIKKNRLVFVKGPALKLILKDAQNDPIADNFTIKRGEESFDVFAGKVDDAYKIAVLEVKGKGYGGDLGLLVAVDVTTDNIYGIGVTTHKETTGLGARAKDDPNFALQFKGLSTETPVVVSGEGQKINALSGSTITSKAVCAATSQANELYRELKPQIVENLKKFAQ